MEYCLTASAEERARLSRLLDAIGMPAEMAAAVERCAETAGEAQPLPGTADLTGHLLTALRGRQSGPWEGVPEDIWLGTMGCFSRFVREHIRSYGAPGFDRAFWTTRQAQALLFRVGAMEYEVREDERYRWFSLHIPSDIALEPEPLNRSVERAHPFLEERFPLWKGAQMRLHSWLISPRLAQLLPPGSRILRFQQAFDIEFDPDEGDPLEWVYGVAGGQRGSVVLADLPEDTSLQRSLKALLLRGEHLGGGRGVLARPFS